jgi:predicted flap endonuclease-1-like 5' DNA nuclease
MGLLERIKSALGLGTSTSSPSTPSSTPDRTTGGQGDDTGPTPVSEVDGDDQVEGARTTVDPGDESDDVDVTVEHEPDTRSEDAVKGTDTAGTGTSADVESAGENTPDADAAGAGADDDTTDADDTSARAETGPGAGVDLEEIKGIGPAYADRLREAGVEDVAALAAADATDLADRTGLGEGRIGNWIEQAEAR